MTVTKQCPVCLSRVDYTKRLSYGALPVIEKTCPVCGAPLYFSNTNVFITYDYDLIGVSEYHAPSVTWADIQAATGAQDIQLPDRSSSEDFFSSFLSQVANLPKEAQKYIYDQIAPTTAALTATSSTVFDVLKWVAVAVIILGLVYLIGNKK